MASRVERFPLLQRPVRQLFKPAFGWGALVAALFAIVRRYTRQPNLPRMSDEWLFSHQTDFNRDQF